MTLASRTAGLAQLKQFIQNGRAGRRYERERNTDFGEGQHANVSRLSPFIRHRLILETEVLAQTLLTEHPLDAEKFIQEVCWRSYWKGWLEQHPIVWQQYCEQRNALDQLDPIRSKAITNATAARTGIECFDAWVNELVATGYLHNHSRMWFASIWIFTLRLPWQAGADFFMQHLCDADAASNTLSWRWVAGLQTKGKHYVARPDNITRYTNGRFPAPTQLVQNALCLTQEHLEIATPSATNGWGLFCKLATKASANLPVNEDSILLLHDEDLLPESFAQLRKVSGLIVFHSSAQRSLKPLGQASQKFVTKALADARARVMSHWSIEASCVIDCADPSLLKQKIDQHLLLAGKPIVTPWIPVGPTRDALKHSGVSPTEYLLRPWDARSWPYASKGFFNFKTIIPSLLGCLHEL
jgi:deoxyribodipyrimidine photo-lyase